MAVADERVQIACLRRKRASQHLRVGPEGTKQVSPRTAQGVQSGLLFVDRALSKARWIGAWEMEQAHG